MRLGLIAIVFLLAAYLRFYDLSGAPPGLFNDEAVNGINALEAAKGGGFQVFYPENNGREGLFINVQALFLSGFIAAHGNPDTFHVEPWMLRLPSAIFGTLTVIGLFFLVRLLTGREFPAGAAAFLLATSVWHINFSRIGLRAISSPFWLIWALFFLLWGFAELARRPGIRGFAGIALGGLLYGAGFHSYLSYRVTPVLIAMVLLWLARDFRLRGEVRTWMKGTALFLGTSAIVVLPLFVYAIRHPELFNARLLGAAVWESPTFLADLGRNAWKTLLMLNVAGDPVGRHNVPDRPELFLPVGILFLCGVVLGIRSIYRRSSDLRPFLLCLVWSVAAVVPSVLTKDGQQPHALRCILLVAPCMVLAALAAERFRAWLETRFSRSTVALAGVVLAFVLVCEADITYFDTLQHHPQAAFWFEAGPAALGRDIGAVANSIPKYVVVVGLPLDNRGNPGVFYELPLLSGGYNEQERRTRNIHFVTDRDEAAQLADHPPAGAQVWVVQVPGFR